MVSDLFRVVHHACHKSNAHDYRYVYVWEKLGKLHDTLVLPRDRTGVHVKCVVKGTLLFWRE